MSYDVHLEMPKCPTCGRSDDPEVRLDGPTYNLSRMFHLALLEDAHDFDAPRDRDPDAPYGLRVLNGKTAAESVAMLDRALVRMADPTMRERFLELNPPNGWGTFESALACLTEYRDLAVEHPTCVWRVT